MEIKYNPNANYRSNISTKKIMLRLLIGLLVVYAFGLYNGAKLGAQHFYNALILMGVALVCSFATEAVYALVTKQNVLKFFDVSFPYITPVIIVLTCSYDTSPYAVAIATILAVLFGKLVFGGFGQNIFNPAAVGKAIILQSFAGSKITDITVGATPTQTLASAGWLIKAKGFHQYLNDFGGLKNLWFGRYEGAIGETSAIVLIAVCVYLVLTKVIDLWIPVIYVGTLFVGSSLISLINKLGLEFSLTFISTGGILFGAVFMLTDPVTSPTTKLGKVIYASLAALFTCLIRFFANLPEGVVFSILLANMLTPVIEKFCEKNLVRKEKKVAIIGYSFIAIVVLCITLCGAGLTKAKDYTPVNPKTGSLNTNVICVEKGGR